MDNKSRILITGGTGFAGSHLVDELINQGIDKNQISVTTLHHDTNNYVEKKLDKSNVYQLDLTNEEKTQQLFRHNIPTHVFHLASIASVGDSFDKEKAIFDNNINLELNILNSINNNCPQARIVNIGSGLVYDFINLQDKKVNESDPLGPSNPYSVSKITQEMLAFSYMRRFDLDIVFARPFNHIGERQALGFVVADFADQIIKAKKNHKKEIKVGNLEAKRDFTDVKDMVRAYILLMNKGETGEFYNIGSGNSYSIRQILDMMIDIANVDLEVKIDKNKLRPVDIKNVRADSSKIRKIGYKIKYNIKETLERILNQMEQ